MIDHQPEKEDRHGQLVSIMNLIHEKGYIYDLNKSSTSWLELPPPPGTKLNCKSAAILMKRIAEQQGIENIKIVQTKIEKGFFVPSEPGIKALGTTDPMVITTAVCGWEFDNHFRVKDCKTNIIYDPIFWTSGTTNPDGIRCTSSAVEDSYILFFFSQGKAFVSVYGDKYEITRSTKFTAKILSQGAVAHKFLVTNKDYHEIQED